VGKSAKEYDTASTIKDIAKLAKVSHTTVSLALMREPTTRVSSATRKRILKIAEDLNYRPNLTARSLATRRSRCIGLVVPTFYNPIYGEFAQEFIDRANDLGYGVMTCSASGEDEAQRRAIEDLLNRGVDGLIICSSYRHCRVVSELNERRVPLVLVIRSVERKPGQALVDFYGVDDHLGGFRVASHLIRMRHTRIGLICGPQETSTGYERRRGALEAFQTFGLEHASDLVRIGDYSRASGYEIGKNFITRSERPTAIFAANDNMAIGVLHAMGELGLRAPDDVALVGYDDMEMASVPGIDLTTVSQRITPFGRAAMDRVIAKIEGRDQNICEYRLYDPVLVIRKSCGFNARGGVYELPEPGDK
jgi:LacI family transcriptional regulator, galactose operon repressor